MTRKEQIIKNYTDIEQSRTLAEILHEETADMCYGIDDGTLKYNDLPWLIPYHKYTIKEYYIPCWSLSALLNVLPNKISQYTKALFWFDDDWYCEYMDEDGECRGGGEPADNPVDACYKMIVKLHEQNLL